MQKKKNQKSKFKTHLHKPQIHLLSGSTLVIIGLIGVAAYFYYKTPNELSAAPTASQIKQGERIFAQSCAVCHGDKGQGEDPSQPMGGVKDNGVFRAPALNGTGHMWHHPNAMLFNIVKNGSVAESPMKGFNGKLSDEEIVSVINYLKSLWPEKIRVGHAKREEVIKQNLQ